MPLAAVLFLAARFGGGMDAGRGSSYGNLFLVLHVGLVLAAFAGFTLAAALAGMYLLEERRLKRRAVEHPQPAPAVARRARAADACARSPSRCRC